MYTHNMHTHICIICTCLCIINVQITYIYVHPITDYDLGYQYGKYDEDLDDAEWDFTTKHGSRYKCWIYDENSSTVPIVSEVS